MAQAESVAAQSITFSEAILLAQTALDPSDGVFLATAVSPWHALGVDAWIKNLRGNSVRTRGVIAILPHSKDGFLINATYFRYANQDSGTTIVQVDIPASPTLFTHVRRLWDKYTCLTSLIFHCAFKAKRTSQPSALIVSPRNANLGYLLALACGYTGFFEHYRPVFVTIDEGLGTYTSDALWTLVGNLDRGSSAKTYPFFETLRRLKIGARNRLMKRFTLESRFLFEFDEASGQLEPVPDIVRDYRALYVHATGDDAALQPTERRPTGIIITQPWSEYKQLDVKHEIELVSHAVTKLLDRKLRVVIKPHPREAAAKYKCLQERFRGNDVQVIQGAKPVEEHFSSLLPGSCVVGYNSTALLTAFVLYNLPAYSFGSQLIGRPTTGELLGNSQRQFDQLFGHIVKHMELLADDRKEV